MYILGFNCYAHDAAAAIIRDGELLGFVEEERFVRKKHVGDFPHHSIKWCGDIAGIKSAELDHIVYYWNPKLALPQRAMHLLRYLPRSLALLHSRREREVAMLRLQQTLKQELGLANHTQIHFADARHI